MELERRSQTTARALRSVDRQQGSGRDPLQCYCGASPRSPVPRFHFRGYEPETTSYQEAPHITNHLSPGLSRLEVIRLLRCRYQEWEKEKRRKVSSGADEFFVLTFVYRCVCNPKQSESHWDQLAATTSRLQHTFRDLGLRRRGGGV